MNPKMNPTYDLIKVSIHRDGEQATILEDYKISVHVKTTTYVINIAEGFITDFATVPKFWQGVFSPLGRYYLAAIAHDWLYVTAKMKTHSMTRKQVDDLFYEIMKQLGIGWSTRYSLWFFVYVFGKKYWDSKEGIQKTGVSYDNPVEIYA